MRKFKFKRLSVAEPSNAVCLDEQNTYASASASASASTSTSASASASTSTSTSTSLPMHLPLPTSLPLHLPLHLPIPLPTSTSTSLLDTCTPVVFSDTNLTLEKQNELINYLNFLCKEKQYSNTSRYFLEKQIKYYLTNSQLLVEKINSDQIKVNKLKNLKLDELYPEKWETYSKQLERIKEKQQEVVSTSLYKCQRCNSNCSFKEEQRRSADEGKTIYLTCVNPLCGFRETLK